MRMPQVGDYGFHKKTYEEVRVKMVNEVHGYFIVQFFSGKTKEYLMLDKSAIPFTFMSPEERADKYLKLENAGFSDNWRD